MAFEVTIKLNTTSCVKIVGHGKGNIIVNIIVMRRNARGKLWAEKWIVSICRTVGLEHHQGTFSEPSTPDVLTLEKNFRIQGILDIRFSGKGYQTVSQNFELTTFYCGRKLACHCCACCRCYN
jgi:hypothetical protein